MSEEYVYVKISLSNGRTYIQPLKDIDVIKDEIVEAILNDDLDSVWTLSLVKMSQEDYEKLPEFMGH